MAISDDFYSYLGLVNIYVCIAHILKLVEQIENQILDFSSELKVKVQSLPEMLYN